MSIAVVIIGGRPGITYEDDSTDTAQLLASAKYTNETVSDNIKHANSCSITVETASIRYAFGVAPTQAGLGHLATSGTVIKLNSYKAIRDFQYISAAGATPGTLQITMGF